MAISYVKFQRGSQAAYDKLVAGQRVDDNTLYFIYPEDNNAVGKLYLGSRLISGGDVVLASTSLADLSDVIVESVKANSFLVQNAEGKWDNLSLADVVNLIKNSANLISELIVEDDDVVILNANGNKIIGSHAEIGPINGASKGATADASISNFGESLQIKVPYVSVDKYGHTTVVDEKILSISIPEAPSFIDTNTTYELRYENDEEGKKVIRLYDGDGAIVSTVDASDFIKDGMLDDVSYNAETNELTFVWNTSSGKINDVVKLTDILDPYNAGNGIKISNDGDKGHTISIKLADDETHLQVNENGLSIDLSDVDTDTTYTLSANNATIVLTPSEGEPQEVTLNVYTKGQTDQAIADKINEVNGGESAGEVLSNLNAYKKNIDTEIWGSDKVNEWTGEDGKYNPDYTETSRIDDLITSVTNLEEALNEKADKTTVNSLSEFVNEIDGKVTDLTAILDNYVLKSDYQIMESDVALLKEVLTWGLME